VRDDATRRDEDDDDDDDDATRERPIHSRVTAASRS
jgi:hypothetical protein